METIEYVIPEDAIEDKDIEYVEVVEVEDADENTKYNAKSVLFLLTAGLLATVIIVATLAHDNKFNDKLVRYAYDDEIVYNDPSYNEQEDNTINNSVTTNNTTTSNTDTKDSNTQTGENNITKETIKHEIDYSNVETFYNHIIANRNKYGKFAESFKSEEDVKNYINFLYKFDEMYDDIDTTTTIDSQEKYDSIVQDYYKSCVSHDIKGELNLLYSNNKLAQQKIAEAEALAYDLKNGKGKDYTIANRYYTWFLVNLIDGRTMVDRTTNNAPFIDALREQFEQYRYSGNMLNARKYQKNDSLPVDSVHLYYADEASENTEVIEIQNSLTCPDWGVDNVISKYEEDEETRLLIKRDNQRTFQTVDDEFKIVLNKGKVR